MKLKKLLAITVALALLVSLNPLPPMAQARDTNITLEEAIQTAKGLFPAATQYSEFVSEFNTSPQSSYWQLQWSAGEAGEGSLSVQINAQTGDVIHMYRWDQQSGQPTSVSMSAQEAQAIADRWLKKILPGKSARLQLVNTPAIVPLNNSGYSNFSFQYQRVENGLPVLGDTAYVDVDARSRDISSFNLSWTDLPLADPSKVVVASVASQTFQNEDMLKLEYLLPQGWLLRSSLPQTDPVRLVYRINHPSGGTINALTGKPLVLKEGQNERYASNMAMKEMSIGGMGAADQAAAPPLTPQEIAELEKQANMITKEEAAAKVKQWVNIPSQAELTRASLNRDWQNKDSRIWNLNWGLPQGTEGEYFDLWARVDATTGRIYSFNQYSGDTNQPGTLSEEQAQAVAQEFISKIEPQLSKQVKLKATDPGNVRPLAEKNLPSQWTVQFVRQVNGVPFPNDGIQVTVSSATKKVTDYNLTWTEQKFPPVNKAMGSAKAYKVFSDLAPMTLCYTPITTYGETTEFLLVYKPQTADKQSGFAMIDAISGEALNSMGDPLNEKPAPYTFNDVTGHFAEKEIQAIGQAGLMNEYGSQFKPDETITNIVFLRAMVGAVDGIWSITDREDDKVISDCVARGWLKEKVDPKADLTRQRMTEVVIRSMGLEKAARYGSLFKNPFPADESIDESKLGYIALANGMNLLHVDKEFKADEAVTRGEAALAIVRGLKI
ncbi:MAG: hypothetical protein GX382_05410 [Syntrophomonadaceae bacterium]|nr:hypothetical protein [Syntrophomonadaceae bacterium]